MTIPYGNDEKKKGNYLSFWKRETCPRPMTGFSLKSWFPLKEFEAANELEKHKYLTPELIQPQEYMNDQIRLLKEGEKIEDDIFRGASAWQAIPWLCGILGSKLRMVPSSIIAEEKNLDWDQALSIRLDDNSPWLKKYIQYTDTLIEVSKGKFPVAAAILIGPTDLSAMIRGHSINITDYIFYPSQARELLEKLGEIIIDITKFIWQKIPLFLNGYFESQYQLWAPGPIIRLQEDAIAVYSPDIYKDFVLPIDIKMASQFEYSFMHLHSTSMFLLDYILENPYIKCFEVNHDDIEEGLPITKLIPYLSKIQKSNRSLLLRGSFTDEEMKEIIEKLNPAGLYLYIMVKDEKEIDSIKKIIGF